MAKVTESQMRLKVYQKYDGHCAYCGKEIRFKDMQVDHLEPIHRIGEWKSGKYVYTGKMEKPENDTIDNMMPACRSCNYYKSSCTLQEFRDWRMKDIHKRIMKIYIAKVAIDYGIITITPFDGKFYFEKLSQLSESEMQGNITKRGLDFRKEL
uniref:Putative homing endonuclease n=1 Tax=viral metagenome TaxID=1070528 RepID=A0A6M3JD53_9ZZZZ